MWGRDQEARGARQAGCPRCSLTEIGTVVGCTNDHRDAPSHGLDDGGRKFVALSGG